jgi:hypothetical protein
MMLISILSGSVFALPIPSRASTAFALPTPSREACMARFKEKQENCQKKDAKDRRKCLITANRTKDQCLTNPASTCWEEYEIARGRCYTNSISRRYTQGISFEQCMINIKNRFEKKCKKLGPNAKGLANGAALDRAYYATAKDGKETSSCRQMGGICTTRYDCPRTKGNIQRIGFCPGRSNIRCCLNAQKNGFTKDHDQPATLYKPIF